MKTLNSIIFEKLIINKHSKSKKYTFQTLLDEYSKDLKSEKIIPNEYAYKVMYQNIGVGEKILKLYKSFFQGDKNENQQIIKKYLKSIGFDFDKYDINLYVNLVTDNAHINIDIPSEDHHLFYTILEIYFSWKENNIKVYVYYQKENREKNYKDKTFNEFEPIMVQLIKYIIQYKENERS